MSRLYDGGRMEAASTMLLETRVMHLAHDLDKTLSTLLGTDAFLGVVGGEAQALHEALSQWESRGLTSTEPILWARAVMDRAQGMRDEASDDTAPLALRADGGSQEALTRLVQGRRSVRRWTADSVDDAVLDAVVDAARWAPSACNRQSVRYLIVRDPEAKAYLAKLREAFIARADALVLLFADATSYFPEEVDAVPYLDAGMAAENALLTAHACGLGAVFVKCTPRDLAAVDRSGTDLSLASFRRRFHVPSSYLPVGIIAMGWPAACPKAPARRDKTGVLAAETFPAEETRAGHTAPTSPVKAAVKRAFIRSAVMLGRRLGLRVFIATD